MVSANSLISIVLPLYKPKGDWKQQFLRNISELNNFLPEEMQPEYIVVYDDKADNKILSVFEEISGMISHVSFISYGENMGKGYALREGVKAAVTPFVITMDFDFPYEKENIRQLILLLINYACDVVIGKRSDKYFMQVPLKRKIISKSFSLLNRIALNLSLNDTQSGMKGFNKRGKQVFLQTTVDRFLVDTEFIMRSIKQGLSINAMTIELRPGITFSSFSMHVLITEFKNFLQLVRLQKELKSTPEPIPAFSMQKLRAS